MNPAKAPFRATFFPPSDMRVERRADGTLVVDWNEGTRREALRRGLGWQGLGRIRVNPTPVPSPTGRETAPSPSSRHPAAAPAAANASAT